MKITEKDVINYLEKNGKLFEIRTWNVYDGEYVDEKDEIARHFSSDSDCKGVVAGKMTYLYEEGKCVSSFVGEREEVVLSAKGYGCECGHFPKGTLGYYLHGSFDDNLLKMIGVEISDDIYIIRY